MPLTNAGRDFIAGAVVGDEATLFDNAHAYLGVGDSDAGFSVEHTDLQGSNTFRKVMDSGYPTRAGNKLIFMVTVDKEEANFAWKEVGIFNALTGGTMLCRKVEYKGIKEDTQTWLLEYKIDIVIGG